MNGGGILRSQLAALRLKWAVAEPASARAIGPLRVTRWPKEETISPLFHISFAPSRLRVKLCVFLLTEC